MAFIYNQVNYASRDAALQAIRHDEVKEQKELKCSRLYWVASLTMTAVLTAFLFMDYLNITRATPTTQLLTVIALCQFVRMDIDQYEAMEEQAGRVQQKFAVARRALGS